jgi:serine phosphatase RsbU (regulator of sigma subunit)
MPDINPEIMQCMEVWGGNQPVDSGVVMAGLDAWVYCRPYAEAGSSGLAQAGGDVYFVSSCATGRITRLLVADVSGHGDAVGSVAVSLRTLMRKYVNFLDPRKFVGEMNRRFAELSKDGCFATSVVVTFFSPTNHATFCNAGHPPPLFYQARKGWSYLEARETEGDEPANLPLGVLDSSAYGESNVTLGLGDMVLCYTDGLPESRRPDGELLGQDGLLEVARSLDVSDPARVVPALLKAIADLHEGNLSGDDITILLFRSNGVGVTTPFFTRLLSPFRVVAGLVKSLLPGGGPAPWPDGHPANIGGALISPLNRLWGRKR